MTNDVLLTSQFLVRMTNQREAQDSQTPKSGGDRRKSPNPGEVDG
jgi:hypothetical protein